MAEIAAHAVEVEVTLIRRLPPVGDRRAVDVPDADLDGRRFYHIADREDHLLAVAADGDALHRLRHAVDLHRRKVLGDLGRHGRGRDLVRRRHRAGVLDRQPEAALLQHRPQPRLRPRVATLRRPREISETVGRGVGRIHKLRTLAKVGRCEHRRRFLAARLRCGG